MLRTLALSSSIACLTLVAGCGGATSTDPYADEAVDSAESALTETSFLVTGDASSGTGTPTAETIATGASTILGQYLQPTGCATTSVSGAKVTVTMTDCSGPYGLVKATGTVTLEYSLKAGGTVHIELKATDLKVNGATLTLNSSGDMTTSGSSKTLSVTTNTVGTGARGTKFARTGTFTAQWTQDCLTLNGTWSTTVALRTWTTTVANYKKCTGMCPSSGGTIAYTGGISGVTTTVSFDGDTTASFVTSRGRSGTVSLFCQ